jgi:phosphatidylglycerol:prolipoprotein diacylglycerol transferase
LEHTVLPELFTIPLIGIPIHTYGVMIVTGFLLGVYIAYRQCLQLGKWENDVLDFGFWGLVGGLIGARVIFIAVEWRSFFIDRPFTSIGSTGIKIPTIFALWQGGLVFWGAIIGGFVAFVIFTKKRGLPTFHLADIVFLGVPLAQMFGRLGCIAAGCCWGMTDFHNEGGNIVANSPFDLYFPPGSSAFESLLPMGSTEVQDYMLQTHHTVPLFPSQLAEAVGCAILFAVLYFIARNKRFHGQVLLSYAMLYSVLRSTLEIFRGDTERGFVIDGWLSTSQFISVLVVTASLVTMWWLRSQARKAVSSIA